MNLKNSFSDETRHLYLYSRECWTCGKNGEGQGGLELHHIWGRASSSPLNSALLCGKCHSRVGHSTEERLALFRKTVAFLVKEGYKLTRYDENFLLWISGDLRAFTL